MKSRRAILEGASQVRVGDSERFLGDWPKDAITIPSVKGTSCPLQHCTIIKTHEHTAALLGPAVIHSKLNVSSFEPVRNITGLKFKSRSIMA